MSLSGYYVRNDGAPLPASTALLLYLHDENDVADFVRGQGVVDPATGNFTANITDLRIGLTRGIVSFVVLDSAEYVSDTDGVYAIDVVNEGCSEAMRIRLEWDSNDYMDLSVADPNGDSVTGFDHATVGGFEIVHTGVRSTLG